MPVYAKDTGLSSISLIISFPVSGKSKVESTSRIVPPILIAFVILVFGFTLNSLKIVPFTLISLEKPESMLI